MEVCAGIILYVAVLALLVAFGYLIGLFLAAIIRGGGG